MNVSHRSRRDAKKRCEGQKRAQKKKLCQALMSGPGPDRTAGIRLSNFSRLYPILWPDHFPRQDASGKFCLSNLMMSRAAPDKLTGDCQIPRHSGFGFFLVP
ncbi:MAG: hypothetical protein DRI57_16570 [Deltaproteobacteria bacterium]|nr:MAG: hypothetical protein DRI57_16570 [Deltaproteobacteria bacterium]